jgi:hypothetical protein
MSFRFQSVRKQSMCIRIYENSTYKNFVFLKFQKTFYPSIAMFTSRLTPENSNKSSWLAD